MDEVAAGDALLKELQTNVPGGPLAPTMGRLKKVAYTHTAMIDLLIEGAGRAGGISQKQIAAHFGYTESWVSNIFASEAFQEALARRREEIVDPTLKQTVKERLDALVRRSLDVLMAKLEQPVVSDTVALRALELGARGLGIGGNAPKPAPSQEGDRLERIANRLIDLQDRVRQGVSNEKSVEGQILPAA